MVARHYQKVKGSPKAQVGEIDTSSPFRSVRDAVTLFGAGAFSGEKLPIKKSTPHSVGRVLAKETQLHLAQKELNKLKGQLQHAESEKNQASVELERAKRTVLDLTQKLKAVNESKDSEIKATEKANHQAKQLEQANNLYPRRADGLSKKDLQTERVDYTAVAAELDAAKQELWKIRLVYDASVKAKDAATKQAAEAEKVSAANKERAGEILKDITTIQESIELVKLASTQAQEEEAEIKADEMQACQSRIEESAMKLLSDNQEVIDPEHQMRLENQLAETTSEIEALRKVLDAARASDLDTLKTVTTELDSAKESLHQIAEEENSLRNLVDTLKIELGNMREERCKLKEKEAEMESVAGDLHAKVQKAKPELVAALAEETEARSASDDTIAAIYQLYFDSESARCEVEEITQQTGVSKNESEVTRIELEAAEIKLKAALDEAEEAQAAETRAIDQIKLLSEKTDPACTSTSEANAHITISREEFESLTRKIEESAKLAEKKVVEALAQVEDVKASENEVIKRLEANQKEIEDIKAATLEALKKADMADAAQKAVEGELRRWRERETQKAAEAASVILAEKETDFEPSPSNFHLQKQHPSRNAVKPRKLEKLRTSVTKKVFRPSVSGMFHKKKNQVDSASPSYLPGEKPIW